ncbi:MAG: 30S ribosomal protein S15 [Rectinema sp.]
MALSKEDKAQLVLEYGKDAKNTGAIESQIALISARIAYLTEHFKTHKKDTNSRRGLLKLVGQRRKLLKYLQRTDLESYRAITEKLQIRK